jgi:CRISPR-associated exonuclease Cas4
MLEYLYCPRFIYFMKVLDIDQREDRRYKVVEGRNAHIKKTLTNPEYMRKKIGVVRKIREQELYDEESGINGKIDEILFLKNGEAAVLDYKYAEYKNKIFKTYKIQALMYALLIKKNYHKEVNKGYLVYTRSGNRIIEIEFKPGDFKKLYKYLEDIRSIIIMKHYPKGTSVKSRCGDCCYRNICTR